jgi:two-component system CheB/CheR fusion protein
MANGLPVVVVVEDDDRLREALARVLAVSGFRVVPFSSSEAAIEEAPWAAAACLLLDIHLPGMSGLELLQFLRERNSRMPAIVLTADTRGTVREAAMRLGVSAYLEKPARGHRVVAAIRETMSKRNSML